MSKFRRFLKSMGVLAFTTIIPALLVLTPACGSNGKEDDSTLIVNPNVDENADNKENEGNTSENENEGNTDSDNSEAENPNEEQSGEEQKEEQSTITSEVLVQVENCIDDIEKGNFTYQFTRGSEYVELNVADDVMKLNNNGNTTYLLEEGDTAYKFSQTDETWYKDLADEDDSSIDFYVSSVASMPEAVEWTDYNSASNLVTGTVPVDGETATVTLDLSSGEFEFAGDEEIAKIFDVGSTAIDLPANYIDNTIESENLKNADGTWNVSAIAETLEDWMIENDYYSQVLNYGAENYSLKKVLWVNVEDTSMTIGALTDADGQIVYENFAVKTALVNKLISNEVSTATELSDYLSNNSKTITNKSNVNCEYTTLDDDYETEHKEEFETLTENVFNRLATVGYQGTSINNEGTTVDLSNAKVLFGFKTEEGASTAGFDMGYKQSWYQYYLIELNGEVLMINMTVHGANTSASVTPLVNVLNDNSNAWMVGSYNETEVLSQNADLYVTTSATKTTALEK